MDKYTTDLTAAAWSTTVPPGKKPYVDNIFNCRFSRFRSRRFQIRVYCSPSGEFFKNHIYIYVCVCVHIYIVRVCVCVCVCMFVCMYVCVCIVSWSACWCSRELCSASPRSASYLVETYPTHTCIMSPQMNRILSWPHSAARTTHMHHILTILYHT